MNAALSKAFSAVAALLLLGAALRAESADDLIKQGDVLDIKLQAAEALKFYLLAKKLQPENAQLLVRIARQYRHLMSDATARDDKLELGGIALDYSLRAAALAPDDSQAQLAPAITYGKCCHFKAVRNSSRNQA